MRCWTPTEEASCWARDGFTSESCSQVSPKVASACEVCCCVCIWVVGVLPSFSVLRKLTDEQEERYVGRTKPDSSELDPMPETAHVTRMEIFYQVKLYHHFHLMGGCVEGAWEVVWKGGGGGREGVAFPEAK